MTSIIHTTNNLIVIDLVKEYGGRASFTGQEHFAVVADTELTAEELKAVEPYKPYVIITTAMFKAFTDNYSNDDRERKRDALYHEADNVETDLLFLVDEYSDPVRICESVETLSSLMDKMLSLPDNQGTRMYKRYVLGFTSREISQQEHVTMDTIQKCLFEARKSFKVAFRELGVIDHD